MRPPRVLDSGGAAFGLAHVRTIVSHPRGHDSLAASFQRENTCTPVRDVIGDIRCVVARYARA